MQLANAHKPVWASASG